MAWWSTNRLRLIQNNLREIDANMDVDAALRELDEFGANVWMLNAGGIFAFYPSKLEHHYVTPYLTKDLLGEAVAKAHRRGVKFIARFDFSKAHESVFAKRPEWFYRTAEGREANYGGIVHTCLNGGYQQEYSLRILEEVLTNYPVDGVFFNMFGYKTTDYSGREYGLCYCDNCRRRFRDMYGEALPARADDQHPVYAAYREFQDVTTREMLEKIHGLVRGFGPDIAICTYHPYRVDIVRKESNTALARPLPTWLYSASENVMSVEDSWDDKLVSNCSINAIDLAYRFVSVSEHETAIRLYESVAAGSGLDFCIIGAFDGYPDGTTLETAKRIFRFHREQESRFGALVPIADAALLKPDGANRRAMQEYYGIFKMLKERHVPFKAVELEALHDNPAALGGVRTVILPGLQRLTDAQEAAIAAAKREGAHVVGTGRALQASPERLKRLFSAVIDAVLEETDAAYVQFDDKRLFPNAPKREWAIVAGPFACVSYERERAYSRLPLVSPSSFGPPERAYGHRIDGRYAGLGIVEGQDGEGASMYYPWDIGALYFRHGYEDHKHALTDPLRERLGGAFALETDAPACVETFLARGEDGAPLLQLINLSGFNGITYRAPLPIRGIRATIRGVTPGGWRARRLTDGREAPLAAADDGTIAIDIGELGEYEAIALEKGGGVDGA